MERGTIQRPHGRTARRDLEGESMADKGSKGGMTVEEAGRLGGKKVVQQYGPDHMAKIGRKGGEASPTKFQSGDARTSQIASKGGHASGGNFANDPKRAAEKAKATVKRQTGIDLDQQASEIASREAESRGMTLEEYFAYLDQLSARLERGMAKTRRAQPSSERQN